MSRSDRKRVAWAKRVIRKSGDRFQRDRLDGLQDFYVWDDLKNRLLDELSAVVEMSRQYQGYPCRYEISVEESSAHYRRVVLTSIKLNLEGSAPFVDAARGDAAKRSQLLFEHKNDGSLVVRLVLPEPIHPFMVDETEVFLWEEPRSSWLLTRRGLRRVRSLVSCFLQIDECLYLSGNRDFFDDWLLRDAFRFHAENRRLWRSSQERAVESHKFSLMFIVGFLAAMAGVLLVEGARIAMEPDKAPVGFFMSSVAIMVLIIGLFRVIRRH